MNKSDLMKAVLPDGWSGKVDLALPQSWVDDRDQKFKDLGLDNPDFHPNFRHVWSYLENRIFGAPVDLLELLWMKIEKGELFIVEKIEEVQT